MKTMLFNPYSGKPRDPQDIASDPSGILMLDPDEPLHAAANRVPVALQAEPVAWMNSSSLTSFELDRERYPLGGSMSQSTACYMESDYHNVPLYPAPPSTATAQSQDHLAVAESGGATAPKRVAGWVTGLEGVSRPNPAAGAPKPKNHNPVA